MTTGTPIIVTAGVVTTGINFALSPGGIIAGTITDALTGAPLSDMVVDVFASNGTIAVNGLSSSAGVYQAAGLTPGTYFARARPGTGALSYVPQAYRNIPCLLSCDITAATPIVVTGTSTTTSIDFALARAGVLQGRVTGGGTGTQNVNVYNSAGVLVAEARDANFYRVLGLPDGTYFVRTALAIPYDDVLYENIRCPLGACPVTSGTPVTVASGATTHVNLEVRPGPGNAWVAILRDNDLWTLQGFRSGWSHHPATPIGSPPPAAMAAGNLDGLGREELVVDLGSDQGSPRGLVLVDYRRGFADARALAPLSPTGQRLGPTQMVTGDFDGDGRDDLAAVFSGLGLWLWSSRGNSDWSVGTWTRIHPFDPLRLAVGQLDGQGAKELIVDFPGFGVFIYVGGTWRHIHGGNSAKILTADLDGNWKDEIVIEFPGSGVLIYGDTGVWRWLHPLNPRHIAVGNLDGDARADLVIDFGDGVGLWRCLNGQTWEPIHPFPTEGLLVADRDQNGRDEILIDFSGGWGLWQLENSSTWTLLTNTPESMVVLRAN